MEEKIALIGGGLSSLVAGCRLSSKGYKVTILEKEDFLGGLASAVAIGNTKIEKLYHHFFSNHSALLSILSELNLSEKLIWKKSTVGVVYNNTIYPFSTPKDILKFKPLDFISKIRFLLCSAYLKFTPSFKVFKDQTSYLWIKKYYGERSYRVIWRPLLIAKFGNNYKNVSMAWLWARIHKRINSRSKLGKEEKLGYLLGSTSVLVDHLEEKIKQNNGQIILNSKIEKVYYEENSKKVVILSNSGIERFDKVIFTTPKHVFNKLVGIKDETVINYMSSICVLFSSNQDLSKYYWINLCDDKSPFSVFIQHTNLVDAKEYNNRHIYYVGAYVSETDKINQLNDAAIKEIAYKTIQPIFPNFSANFIKDTDVFRFKDSQHIVDKNTLLQEIPNKTPIPNVWLFNFSQNDFLERNINKAVNNGEKIANTILSS